MLVLPSRSFIATLPVFASVMLAGQAASAPVFTTEFLSANGSEIDAPAAADFVGAVNVGGGEVTVNGVTSDAAAPAGIAISSTPGSASFSGADRQDVFADGSDIEGLMATGLQSDLDTSASTQSPRDTFITLTLSGLDDGTSYRVQTLHLRAFGSPTNSAMNVFFGTKDTGTLLGGITAADEAPTITTVDFTASGGTQVFTFDATNNVRAAVNGVSVSVVPEPGALGMLGLGALALLRRRGN